MNKQLLFCALVASLTACQQDGDIEPSKSSLIEDVAGTYHTNVFLDPSSVAVLDNEMPYAELKAESDSTVTVTYTKLSPAQEIKQIQHVNISRQADTIFLKVDGITIGTLQPDRVFTNSGMEKQGRLLRLSIQQEDNNALNFAGAR